MKKEKRLALEGRRQAALDEIHQIPNLMRGSVYERDRICGRAGCQCATVGPKHRAHQLTVNLKGRTRARYVRLGERDELEAMIGAYRRLWELVEELTEVNLELLHADPAGAKRR